MTHKELLQKYESEAMGAFASAEYVASFMQEMPAPDSENATEQNLQDMGHLRRILAVAERIVARYAND